MDRERIPRGGGTVAAAIAAMVALLVVALAGCRGGARDDTAIVVAGGDSPEQVLLGKITLLVLREEGYGVVDKTALGSPWVVRRALEAGNVDLSWEYTGDTWLVHQGHDRPVADPTEAYQLVAEEDATRGISWLAPAPCRHTMGMVMRREDAAALGIGSIGDLARHVAQVDPFTPLCTPEELYGPAGGVRGIERVYGVRFNPDYVRHGSIEEGYARVAEGECLCALGYSLDAGLITHDLVVLTDDRAFFQASNLAVGVRTPVLEAHPGLEETLTELAGRLTRDAMASMLRAVVVDEEKPEGVARRFLVAEGLLKR